MNALFCHGESTENIVSFYKNALTNSLGTFHMKGDIDIQFDCH